MWDVIDSYCRAFECPDLPDSETCATLTQCEWDGNTNVCYEPGVEMPCMYFGSEETCTGTGCIYDQDLYFCKNATIGIPCSMFYTSTTCATTGSRCHWALNEYSSYSCSKNVATC
jgi:hypothetical protein